MGRLHRGWGTRLALAVWLAVGLGGPVEAANKSSMTVSNTTLTLTDTEYSFTIPARTKSFDLKSRGGQAFKLTCISGQSGTTYVTIPADTTYWQDELYLTDALTCYAQSSIAGVVLELVSWQ
mgnify:FL=1